MYAYRFLAASALATATLVFLPTPALAQTDAPGATTDQPAATAQGGDTATAQAGTATDATGTETPLPTPR
jgi:hypothetical protein